jgi:hypothetical protein
MFSRGHEKNRLIPIATSIEAPEKSEVISLLKYQILQWMKLK